MVSFTKEISSLQQLLNMTMAPVENGVYLQFKMIKKYYTSVDFMREMTSAIFTVFTLFILPTVSRHF